MVHAATLAAAAAIAAGIVSAASVSAQAPASTTEPQAPPEPVRFQADIEAFRDWDTKNAFPADAVLFVGSSSIRMWPTAVDFPDLPVINRGFGGSQIPDVLLHLDSVVLKYRPAVVVFYAGDNDVNSGRTPEQVLADYRTFVERVRAGRTDTRFVFVPIKPSLARWTLWPEMQRANALVRAHSEPDPRHY